MRGRGRGQAAICRVYSVLGFLMDLKIFSFNQDISFKIFKCKMLKHFGPISLPGWYKNQIYSILIIQEKAVLAPARHSAVTISRLNTAFCNFKYVHQKLVMIFNYRPQRKRQSIHQCAIFKTATFCKMRPNLLTQLRPAFLCCGNTNIFLI